MDASLAAIPTDVVVAADRRSVALVWPDHHATLDASLLRASCRCGPCSAARARGTFATPDPETAKIAAIHPFGGHALNLVFGDGHDKGVFPWVYLREIAFSLRQ